MYVTDSIRLFYGLYFVLISLFLIWFIIKVRKKGHSSKEEAKSGIDKRELVFFSILISVIVIAHIVTLSNWVPWQKWRLWSNPTPVERFEIGVGDYKFNFPPQGMTCNAGEFVEFALTSSDVTYGFGVFRQDGTMVFQLQVIPGYTNRYVWNFSEPGYYDVRSTEYSGYRHSEMIEKNAIHVKSLEVIND